MTRLNPDKTWVSVTVAASIAGAVAAGAWWMGGFKAQVDSMQADLGEVRSDVKSLLKQSKEVAGPERSSACKPCQYSLRGVGR